MCLSASRTVVMRGAVPDSAELKGASLVRRGHRRPDANNQRLHVRKTNG